MNVVVLVGHLSSAPVVRELPSGSVLMTFELTTRVDEGAISVPLVWFDPPANVDFDAGDVLSAVGTVRRRFYRAGSVTHSRTEVVVASLGAAGDKRLRATQRKWIERAMGGANSEPLRS